MCGGSLEVSEGITVAECEYCGTNQTVPKAMDENLQNLYNRANALRIKCEFDKAEKLYEKIIQADSTQPEAYWGIILCKYGIEYVDDPTTFKKIPTCHRASYDSVIADDDYKSAINNADISQRGLYEEQAKEIERIQKEILTLAQKEETYDVFICYKETDNEGKRTQDSVIANDIYYQLTNEGFKVFYAAITLEGKLGSAYEPIIFAALNSAKVMLSIGTKPEYFNAVWVKNEWSRFLKIIQKDRSKLLIPCYRDMDAYELPEEFAHLQAQDMAKIGFINDIVRGIKKVIEKDEPKQNVVKETVITTTASNTNIAPLLKRSFMFLEDGEWDSAVEYCEKVLDLDPECAEAYLGKLMASQKVKNQVSLKDCAKPFDINANYKKIVCFANDELKNELASYIEYIKTRNEEERIARAKKLEKERIAREKELENERLERENERLDKSYNRAVELLNKGSLLSSIQLLEPIKGHKDSKTLLENAICRKKELIITILAPAEQNGKWGYINEVGEFVIKPQFDKADRFFENGLARVMQNGKYGYINEIGEFVTQPQFDEAENFSKNGLARVKRNDKCGYINETGEIAIQLRFDYVPWCHNYGDFSENGFARVMQYGKHGCINEIGDFVIQPKFEWIGAFSENGLANVEQNGKWGYINKIGEFVIQPKFDRASSFSQNGLACVRVGEYDNYGYINKTGEFVIEPKFEYAEGFSKNGLAYVREEYERSGKFINETGKAFEQYGEGSYYYDFSENGLARARHYSYWGYVNKKFEFVIKPQFSEAGDFSKNGLAAAKQNGAKQNGKYGYINEAGEFVIQPKFESVEKFSENGLAAAKQNGKWGYINEIGEFVIQPQFDCASNFSCFFRKNLDDRNMRCQLLKQKIEKRRLTIVRISEVEKALAVQKAIYTENAYKFFGEGAKLKKAAKAEIPKLEAEIANLKRSLK